MILMEAKMDRFVGLDVSQEMTHLCVIGADGKIAWQGKCLSTPENIAGTIRSKAPDVQRIGLESGPLSTWHWHALKAMGLPVVCLDSRQAQATMSGQVNKTDKNDAYGLAQIVKAGAKRTLKPARAKISEGDTILDVPRSLVAAERHS
jgi:transposase